jgi:hypothetical protein
MNNLISKLFKKNNSKTDHEKLEEYVDKTTILERVAKELKQVPELENYNWLKSKNQFKLKTKFGNIRLDLDNWVSVDIDRNEPCIIIRPQVFIRHNFLHTWFEEFSFKSKSDQKNSWTNGFSPEMLGFKDEYNFLRNFKDLEKDISLLKPTVVGLLNEISNFTKPEQIFNAKVQKMINNQDFQFPLNGIEWAFESLILAKNYTQKEYLPLKEKIINHIEILNNNEEPNVREYYSRLYLIINKLEKIKVPNTV